MYDYASRQVRSLLQGPEFWEGYYSIIQFCPDSLRDERINIGVFLEVPSYGFAKMKGTRHITRIARCIDPDVDVKLLQSVLEDLQDRFRSNLPSQALNPLSFPGHQDPIKIKQLQEECESSPRSVWRVTPPEFITLPAHKSFYDELNSLYETLVKRPKSPSSGKQDKDWVQGESYSRLKAKNIILELDPPIEKGNKFKKIIFDARYRRGSHVTTFLDFFSFAVQSPDMKGVIAFHSYVKDHKDRWSGDTAHKFQYGAIIKAPPEGSSLLDDYQEALEIMQDAGVDTFEVTRDIDSRAVRYLVS